MFSYSQNALPLSKLIPPIFLYEKKPGEKSENV
jgi:hypothetical protein